MYRVGGEFLGFEAWPVDYAARRGFGYPAAELLQAVAWLFVAPQPQVAVAPAVVALVVVDSRVETVVLVSLAAELAAAVVDAAADEIVVPPPVAEADVVEEDVAALVGDGAGGDAVVDAWRGAVVGGGTAVAADGVGNAGEEAEGVVG